MKNLKWIIGAAAVFTIISCNSTQVISSYKDEKVAAKDYKKILVLGIFQQKERSLRQEAETQLVNRLKDQGYNAVSAMDDFGPKAFEKVSEDQLAANLKTSGYDAVITTALLDKTKEENYQPGTSRLQPVGVFYNRFGRYYSTIYDRIYQPGYYTTSTDYFLESNLYDIKSGDLIYSIQTKSYDPSSATTLASDNSKKVVRDLKDKGVFAKK
ncbi:MAG: hypothetical protein LH615_14245 [Ferruginibacter sp.]|nr:hypothetical protein [Ferruginibacter sp.]